MSVGAPLLAVSRQSAIPGWLYELANQERLTSAPQAGFVRLRKHCIVDHLGRGKSGMVSLNGVYYADPW